MATYLLLVLCLTVPFIQTLATHQNEAIDEVEMQKDFANAEELEQEFNEGDLNDEDAAISLEHKDFANAEDLEQEFNESDLNDEDAAISLEQEDDDEEMPIEQQQQDDDDDDDDTDEAMSLEQNDKEEDFENDETEDALFQETDPEDDDDSLVDAQLRRRRPYRRRPSYRRPPYRRPYRPCPAPTPVTPVRRRCKLTFHAKFANGLADRDIGLFGRGLLRGQSDPYMKVTAYYGYGRWRKAVTRYTRSVPDNQSPRWKQSLYFGYARNWKRMVVQVFDKDHYYRRRRFRNPDNTLSPSRSYTLVPGYKQITMYCYPGQAYFSYSLSC